MKNEINALLKSLVENVKKNILVTTDTASIVDPIFHIQRNRVNAEFCKTVFRLNETEFIKKIVKTLVQSQNDDGSWNEIHPLYNQPSALITSFIADSLVQVYNYYPQENAIKRAKDFVLSQEEKTRILFKVREFTADYLNVNASCGAFLAAYGAKFSDRSCIDASSRAAKRVVMYQPDGAYLYTSDKGNLRYAQTVPCIHYQGVTMYYLIKIYENNPQDWIKESLLKGGKWLASVQNSDGTFDWSKSGLMFSYHLTGSYAFALSSFMFLSQWDPEYINNSKLCLQKLQTFQKGILLRWEPDSWLSIPPSIIDTFRAAKIGSYPMNELLFRIGYGLYREVARRRFAEYADDRIFRFLCRTFNIGVSTIDPMNNYPDMFMTSEVLDCLSFASSLKEYHETSFT